jgi:hypothetical protein
MRRALTSGTARIVLFAGLCAATPASRAADPAEILGRAQAIRPLAHERKWEQVPWLLDLNHALRLAREEQRPLLLWGSDDDPLERC